MKKYIPILLATSLLLSACSIDWNDEKDKKIAELEKNITEIEKQKENNIFSKKQECLKFKSEIEKDLIEKEKQNKDGEKYILEQIFYSKKNDSCYFVSISEGTRVTMRWLYEYGNHSWYSKSEYLCNYHYDDAGTKIENGCDELEQKIKELKGEEIIDVDKEYENYLKVINKS